MKKIILIILCICFYLATNAQVSLKISSGAYMVTSGNTTVVADTGRLVNNGSYTDSAGTFIAKGGITFSGSGVTRMNNLIVNNAQNSTVNSLVSVYNTTNLVSGNLNANNNLYVRSDKSNAANMVVSGVLTNNVKGIIARASVTSGACPSYTSNLTLNISGPVVKYQWQSSADSATWTNIGGATLSTYTPTVTVTAFYRCNLATTNSSFVEATPGIQLLLIGTLPDAGTIAGTATVCAGATTTLSDAVTGGLWSASNGNVTVDGSGNVTGVAVGTTTISYTVTNGCGTSTVTNVVTVNPLPDAGTITGPSSVNAGSNITLTDAVTGGTWSASNANATVTGGVVTGVSTGTVTITYIITTSCGADTATTVITINAVTLPAITGASTVCAGSSITLSDAASGGAWSSGAVGVATITPVSGVLTGVTAGTVNITYTTSTGFATTVITVIQSPSAIAGTRGVCAGSATDLSDAIAGGSWISSNANATVSSTGTVTGVTTGTAGITYTLTNGCLTAAIVTVNPLPGIISGAGSVCVGTTITLSDATSAGVWTSDNTSFATVGSSSGIVSGASSGVVNISYTIATGCSRSYAVTVNPISAVLGNGPVCVGATITLSDTSGTGTWSSSVPLKATVGSATGVVTGAASGTSSITYTTTAGCKAAVTVTVNPISAITGSLSVCQDATTALTNATAGGTWTSSNTSAGSVSATGVVSGIAAGTTTISYSITATGCASGVVVTVNPITPVLGTLAVCVGATTTLSDVTPGGTWSSSNTASGTVGTASGIVTGIAAGTSTITYLEATGCKSTAVLTVNPISAILGATTLCSGSTITLSNATTGGTWMSSNTSVATIGSVGSPVTVSGVAGGTSVISYTTGAGCSSGVVISVNQTPVISGANNTCIGLTSALSSDLGGGTWSSLTPGHATINVTSGLVSGVGAGTTNISYTMPSGCKSGILFTVNSNPLAISGSGSVCLGNTLSLSDITTGGAWSVDVNASVDGSGNVTGTSAGTGTVTYALTTGCMVTKVVTVDAIPAAFSGGALCAGSTLSLTNSVSGGTWASGNFPIATVGSSSGIVTGVAGGTASITYTTGPGAACMASATVTVEVLQPILGNPYICVGGTDTLSLSDGTAGGTWSTGSSTATVNSSGVVTGLSVGTASVTYSIPSGCARSIVININPAPLAVSGITSMCIGNTVSLSDTGTGKWSSSYAVVASVGSSSGIVTGQSAGTATITYSPGAGCLSTITVTVNPNLATISGPSSVCLGATVILTDASAGVWSSSNGNATIDGSGNVTGVTVGTSTITYMNAVTGCFRTYLMTIQPVPSGILGTTTLCVGGTTTLSDATSGALSWTSSNTAVATAVNSGVVTGAGTGTAIITYKVTSGCIATTIVSVMPQPASISGAGTAICPGTTIALTDAAGYGTWVSSNTSVATVGTDGTVAGVVGGTATISYIQGGTSGCTAGVVVTVTSVSAITGGSSLCANATLSLHNTTTGGVWSTSDPSVAAIGSATGIVSGATAGTVTVIYTLSSGCTAALVVTVNAAPSAILGNSSVCTGSTTTLSDAMSGGTWSSSLAGHASIGSLSGIVTGVVAGTTIITYTSGGCYTTAPVTVNSQPGAILGSLSVCSGASVTLSNTTSGGTWSSSDGSVATIGSATGAVSSLLTGTTTVVYTTASGCSVSVLFSVNAAPGPINGTTALCAGASTTLTDGVPGGAWSSSNGNVSIDAAGNATAAPALSGTATITYTMPGGCYATTTVTVTNYPSAILGNVSICRGATSVLSDNITGGTWASTGGAATIGTASGLVTAVTAGTSTVVYSVGSGCTTSLVVTVNALPQPISGTPSMCLGFATALTDTGSGTWNSSNNGIATVSSSGLVTSVTTGTVNITYTAAVTGCIAVQPVTVNANPLPIQGSSSVCAGLVVSLSDATAGGAWSSNNAVVSIDGSGSVTGGASAGTSVISYTLGTTGCYVTYVETVKAAPSAILGTTAVCAGGTTTLSDATTGAISWGSSNTLVATAANSGVVTGVSAGTATITYTITSGCIVTTVVTVLAPVSSITGGSSAICPGISVALTDALGAGTWSINNGNATIGSATGIVTGVTAGTAVISYTASAASGCSTSTVVTINPAPAISGSGAVCSNASITLSDAVTGGAWSSDNTAIGSVSAGGVVSGVSAGTVTISYTTPATCVITKVVTVNAAPPAILGTLKVCQGGITVLSNAVSGGNWATSNGLTSVDASGNVTGMGTGTSVVSYTISGCTTTAVVTANPVPMGILGTFVVCAGATTTLSDGTAGGTWSSTSAATVGPTGIVTGASAGTATISYILSTGCGVAATVTVNATPTAIQNNTAVCIGTSITLTDAVSGGTWSSSNGNASIGSSTGLLTGVTGGTSTISYTASGCRATAIATVNVPIGTVNGASSVCAGLTITLTDATTGGTWASSTPATGTVSAGGVVRGIAAGSTTITYTGPTGCFATKTITVNASPSAIMGLTTMCQSSSTTLTDATTGGTWSISGTLIATIGSATGVVTTNNTYTGSATVSYTTAGCPATTLLVVNAVPKPIQGVTSECSGVTIVLTDAVAGGVWSVSGNATIAGSTGALTAGAAGTASVTYTTGAGCQVTYPNTIYANPVPISGTFTLCAGSTTSLSDATSGAISWTSSNTTVATAINSGAVTGVAAGTSIITYKILTGSCIATQVVTVNALPVVSPISGPTTISHATPATLSDATAGGVWTSSSISIIALTGTTGNPVTATAVASSGSSVIRYIVTNLGCTTTVSASVSAAPAPPHHGGSITGGSAAVYIGGALSIEAIAGGEWNSSDDSTATVDNYGTVTGIRLGSANITHITIDNNGNTTKSVTLVEVTNMPAVVSLIPNPNKGVFMVKGITGTMGDEEVTLEVTDVLGQVIYKDKITAHTGTINETVALSNTLANGMYMLSVQGSTVHKVFHFVIEQ